ncbi:mucolipin-3-like [Gastrophryne carolinensis]
MHREVHNQLADFIGHMTGRLHWQAWGHAARTVGDPLRHPQEIRVESSLCAGPASDESNGKYSTMESPVFTSTEEQESPYASKNISQEFLHGENLRRKLKFFFMNPCEKFRARGRKPWKLCIQILKIALVTVQLVLFGLSNEMVVVFKEENSAAFKHLFLKDYKDARDDTYAVYRQEDVYNHIDFTIKRYLELRNISLGNHAYDREKDGKHGMTVCQYFYKQGRIFPGNETFDIDPNIQKECFWIEPMTPINDVQERVWNMTLDFYRLVIVEITFKIKAINLQTIRHHELPDCYDFTVTITFDNKAHSGQIKITLDNDIAIEECREWHVSGSMQKNTHYMMIFDAIIILVCVTSLTLCVRSVLTGFHLQREYVNYVEDHCSKSVSQSDRFQFVNGWYILIIISDILTIVGSILKMEIQAKSLTSYDVCSILLGTSTLLVWLGVIRYLGFFEKYNLLILTLRAAIPNVLRFCCCAAMIYLGYCFCGWIVLGPYHNKFRSLTTVSECLFSLINGDDMFTTFSIMQEKSLLVWLFSRFYLYTFISLFIYMVLSLFIALITDTYDTIKNYQKDGFPQSDLDKFISECKDLPTSSRYREQVEMPYIALAEDSLAEDSLAEDSLAEDSLAEDSLAEDSLAEDSLAEDALAEDALAEDALAEDALAEDALAEDSLAEDALAEDSLAEDALAEDALAEDALAEDALAEDALAEDSLAEDALAEDALAEDALAEDSL